jgi:site-specific DNA recombinase
MVLERGMGARAIARELDAKGVPTPHGGRRWARTTTRKIVTNMTAVYAGRGHYNTLKRQGKTLRPRPESERIAVAFPRIISDDDALQVSERFRKISELSEGKTKREYLLRRLMFCGECGRRLGAWPIRGEGYYRCSGKDRSVADPPCGSRSIRASYVEALAWAQVVALLRDPAMILEEARKWRDSRMSDRDELEMRLARIDAAIQKIPAERQRAITGYVKGWLAEEDAKRQVQDLDRERGRLEDERRQIASRLSLEQADEAQSALLESIVQRSGRRLERLTYKERFDLIHSFVERVTVHKDGRVEIRAFIPIPERGVVRDITC